jgi:hypothetical protein
MLINLTITTKQRVNNILSSTTKYLLKQNQTTSQHQQRHSYTSFKLHRLDNNSNKLVLNNFKTITSSSTLSTLVNRQNKMTGNLYKVNDKIIVSHQDNRPHKGLILENGMKCLLISDPTTDRSAAAVDVNIGYLLDPKEFPGLAHFCEHMLFMGSKKVIVSFSLFIFTMIFVILLIGFLVSW